MKTKRRAAMALLALVGVLFLSVTFSAHAQSQRFQVIAFTDLGGSVSSGGAYTVSGTVGQPNVGQSSNEQFGISDGFWNVVATLQTPDAPLVSVEQLANGSVRIFWPLTADGFVLDHSPSIDPSSLWSPVQLPQETSATHISVTIPAPEEIRFYRLRSP
jgi:hypothetical protein